MRGAIWKLICTLTVVIVYVLVIFGLTLQASNLQKLELNLYDLRLRYLAQGDPLSDVWLIGIDELSFQKLGPLPWPRTVYGAVTNLLRRNGVKVVLLDIVFDENKEPEDDIDFKTLLQECGGGVIYGGILTKVGTIYSPPKLAPFLSDSQTQKLIWQGIINYRPDIDGKLRWYITGRELTDTNPNLKTKARTFYPALAILGLTRLEGITPQEILLTDNFLRVGTRRIPISYRYSDDRPFETLIKFFPAATGPGHKAIPGTTLPYASIGELIDENSPLWKKLATAQAVIIGENTKTPVDLVNTPLGKMKGFEAHAQFLCNLIKGDFIYPLSDLENLIICFIVSLLLTYLLWNTLSFIQAVKYCILVITGYVLINLFLFYHNYYAVLLPPILSCILLLATAAAYYYWVSTRTLASVVATEVVKEAVVSDSASDIKSHEIEATIVLTDIRGYTNLSETKRPLEIMNMLNEYHDLTVKVYHKYGGEVVTYQGDAQIILFQASNLDNHNAFYATAAALEAQQMVDELRKRWNIEDSKKFAVGAGICTGKVSLAVLGGHEQRQSTVVGEIVRKAHKVQHLSAELNAPVLLDNESYKACRNFIITEPRPPQQLPGFEIPVPVYKAIDINFSKLPLKLKWRLNPIKFLKGLFFAN